MVACTQYLKRIQNTQDVSYSTPLKFKNIQKAAFHQLNHLPQNTTNNNYQHKLPVNLFYTAAEYNKMLITNGRSVKKKLQPMMQGYISTLQFINQPFFQSYKKHKSLLKKQQKQSAHTTSAKKPNQSITQDCICCCCEEYCKNCKRQQNNKKINQQCFQNVLTKINQKSLKNRKIRKRACNLQTPVQSYQKINKFDKKVNNVKECANMSKKLNNQSLSHKKYNIDSLVYQSLTKFQNQKRQAQLKKYLQNKKKQDYTTFMKKYQKKIRQKNRPLTSSLQRRQIKKSSQSKTQKGKQYWKNIRQIITRSLSKQKMDKNKQKPYYNLYQNIQYCHHPVHLLPSEIVYLALKHQQQAKYKIAKQYSDILAKNIKISNNLFLLQKHRIQHINHCKKKCFQPTKSMINDAFKIVNKQQQGSPSKTARSKSKFKKIKS